MVVDVRDRLAKMAGPAGIQLLTELFLRSQGSQQGVDARRFRIDFKDQRDQIRKLENKFIQHTWGPIERYRLNLVALPLIDLKEARAILKVADRLLRRLVLLYENDQNRPVTIAELSNDLHESQETISEVVGYVIHTPVAGPRTNGYPDSPDWGLTPIEQSLDYPNLEALLNQLTKWIDHDCVTVSLEHAFTDSSGLNPQPNDLPLTLYDRTINRLKNHKMAVPLLLVFVALIVLARSLNHVLDLFMRLRSML